MIKNNTRIIFTNNTNAVNKSSPYEGFPSHGVIPSHPFLDRILHGLNHPVAVPPFVENPHVCRWKRLSLGHVNTSFHMFNCLVEHQFSWCSSTERMEKKQGWRPPMTSWTWIGTSPDGSHRQAASREARVVVGAEHHGAPMLINWQWHAQAGHA